MKEIEPYDIENDPWLIFQGQMAEDFFQFHRATMPENPHDVWDMQEVGHFCYGFTFFAAKMKFKNKYPSSFQEREVQYKSVFQISPSNDEEAQELYSWTREYEKYIELLDNGFSSIFSAITKGTYNPACKVFVSNACKMYIFSQRDMVKIVKAWVIDKNMEFDRNVEFK